MTRSPAIGETDLVGWRLDRAKFAATWDSGKGAFQVGGRWNNEGVRAVYAAIDPATALIEAAAHTGFRLLDAQPHVLTSFRIEASAGIHVVQPGDVPNPNWLQVLSGWRQQPSLAHLHEARMHFVADPTFCVEADRIG